MSSGLLHILPVGRHVLARRAECHAYATLDESLGEELKWDREKFLRVRCLDRGTITHDGLPYQLPVEMQSMVYAMRTFPTGLQGGSLLQTTRTSSRMNSAKGRMF